jgi:excisionase family DNA binding protein
MNVSNNNDRPSNDEKMTLLEKVQIKSYLSTVSNLTVDECVIYTGLAKSYIYKLTHAGIIPHSKPNGRRIIFNRLELDDWLFSNKVESADDLSDFIKHSAKALNRKASINYR